MSDGHFASIRCYNRLLLQTSFYQKFHEYSHILICQLDVCIMRKLEISHLLKYDYVGSPCTFELGDKLYVGNGGFSIRKVAAFIESLQAGFNPVSIPLKDCSNYRHYTRYVFNKLLLHKVYITSGLINEDLVFSLYLKRQLIKPTLESCLKFCQDAFIDEDVSPMAFHGWETNLSNEGRSQCLKQIKM